MKRMILCKSCSHKKLNDDHQKVINVRGLAIKEYRCDWCGKMLPKDLPAVASSIMNFGERYNPWESEYLKIREKKARV